MLQFVDFLLTVIHLVVIFFNLSGWLFPRLLKAHLIFVLLTLSSWFLLGIWYGIGYCPITDWQWQVKEQLGEKYLPASFIKYYADKLSGKDINAILVDWLTGIGFGIAIIGTSIRNYYRIKNQN